MRIFGGTKPTIIGGTKMYRYLRGVFDAPCADFIWCTCGWGIPQATIFEKMAATDVVEIEGNVEHPVKKSPPSALKSFLAGGVGGVCLVASGHPLDTIKVTSCCNSTLHLGLSRPRNLSVLSSPKSTAVVAKLFGLFHCLISISLLLGSSPNSAERCASLLRCHWLC